MRLFLDLARATNPMSDRPDQYGFLHLLKTFESAPAREERSGFEAF
jgi:hypothetical protein